MHDFHDSILSAGKDKSCLWFKDFKKVPNTFDDIKRHYMSATRPPKWVENW